MFYNAAVVEQADTTDLKSVEFIREGSTPFGGTNYIFAGSAGSLMEVVIIYGTLWSNYNI